MIGPPRPLLALALGVACVLAALVAWRFRDESGRIALSPWRAWRDLAGKEAVTAATTTALALVSVLASFALARLGVGAAYWAALFASLTLDLSLFGLWRATPAFASAIQKANGFADLATERDDLESAAAHAEGQVASIWSAPVPILELEDLETGVITRVSETFARAVGYAPDDLLGRDYLDFLTPDCRAATVAAVARARVEGVVPVLSGFRNEWTAGPHHRAPGSEVHMDWSPVGDDGRTWIGYDLTADVLRARAAEEDLAAIGTAALQSLRKPSG